MMTIAQEKGIQIGEMIVIHPIEEGHGPPRDILIREVMRHGIDLRNKMSAEMKKEIIAGMTG